MPPPSGTSIEPSSTGPSGLPSVYWRDTLDLGTQGCPGGSATYTISGEDGALIETSPMSEGPPGTYSATAGPLFPNSGSAHVSIAIDCPGADDEQIDFDIYIDPSGVVQDTFGNPVAGATVTLFRSSTGLPGTFVEVPDGSAVMSPSNRTNPDTTDAAGRFGWDVIADFYLVRAERSGCVSPDDPQQTFVESDVLEIPPPVTDLVLVLDCGEAGTLTLNQAMAWPRRSKAGRIVAKGSLPGGLLDFATTFSVAISDGLAMAEEGVFEAGDCEPTANGGALCQHGRHTVLRLDPSRTRPGELAFRCFMRDRDFVKPQAGPITMVIRQDGAVIAGSIDGCVDQESRLRCRGGAGPLAGDDDEDEEE
ncbi:MAG: carboxypeptidase-like regulatory domain-containing protein [Thermodesulfobacteriota bacterium]